MGENNGVILMGPEFLIGQFFRQILFRIQQHQASFAAYKSNFVSFGRKCQAAGFFRGFINEGFCSRRSALLLKMW